MRILAFDTSTAVASVAVVDDGKPLSEVEESVQARHGETLLPRIDTALRNAGGGLDTLDLIAVGIGPGSFTGVRVGLATAKGLALATGKPLVGVVSLRILARGALTGAAPVVPVLDAYKDEVYLSIFASNEGQRLQQLHEPVHAPPDRAAEIVGAAVPDGQLILCGDGAHRYARLFVDHLGPRATPAGPECDLPRAVHLAFEARLSFDESGPGDLATLEPLYLRPSDARLPDRSLRVEP